MSFTGGAASGSLTGGGGKAGGFGSPASTFGGDGSAVVPEPGTIGVLNRRRRHG